MASEVAPKSRSKRVLPFPLTFSIDAHVVPREDLQPDMVVHSTQLLEPTPEEVYSYARTGLTNNGIAALLDINVKTLMLHFPRTVQKARAEKASILLQHLETKTFDHEVKGDMAALKILLNRVDREDKVPETVIQQQFNLPPGTSVTIDDLNNLLIE